MKITILLNTSWYIYNFRKNLIKSLISSGYEVHAIAPYDDFSEKLKALGCIYHQLDFNAKSKNPVMDLLLMQRIKNKLREINPDVLLNFTIKPNVYGTFAAASLKIPTINNIAGRGTFFDESSLSRFIFKFLFRISQYKAEWVFCQNPEDFEFLTKERIIDRKKASLLPGSGVNLEEFPYTPANKRDKQVILLMARMIYPKGIRELVEASHLLYKKSYKNIVINLLGESGVNNPDAISAEVLTKYNKHSYINYLGKTSEVYKVIQDCDVLVLPSYYREGTPKSLLEALAVGRPVITTNMPGCKETVMDGKNGYLIEPRSISSLVGALEKFLKLSFEEKLDMGLESRKLAETKFDEEFVIKEYNRVIQYILKKGKNK